MIRVTAAFALVLLACSGVRAATTPTEALQEVFARANQILTDPETTNGPLERLLAVRKLVNEAFDFRSAAVLASGDHWQARTAAEQEEFTWLFGDLLERAFVSRMASKASLERGTRIRYLDESIEEDMALVTTAMARRDGGELLLDYYLIERAGAWKVRDIAIDGVSLMANYRSQLDRVLGTASFPELLTQMRAKAAAIELSARGVARVDADAPAAGTTVGADSSVAVVPAAASPPPALADPAPAADTVPANEGTPPIEVVSIVDVPLPEPEVRLAVSERSILAALEKPAPSAAPAPHTYTTKAYWLRIMAAGTADEASRLMSRLRGGKHAVGLERTTVNDRLLIHVRVGPFHDAEEAVLELLALQTKGHDPYLVAERE